MIYANEYRPERLQCDKLIVEELPDELMVYDAARKKAFCLNQTAAFVWKHSDGKTTVGQIAELMTQNLGKPVNEQVVRYALDILAKDGLLVPDAAHLAVPAGVTRRQLLQRFGVGAAAAIPLVTVLMTSPAKAHASTTGDPSNNNPWQNGNQGGNNGGFWGWLSGLF